MGRSFVAANWKMNGQKAEIESLLDAVLPELRKATCEIAICPPSVYLGQVQEKIAGSEVLLGAQNIHTEDKGAYTGEISAQMVKDFDCRFVLVGHSERRELFAESDDLVAEKFASAQTQGLTPILCIGESQAQREAGETEAVILRQVNAVIDKNGIGALNNAVLAYEPIWAIGTGLTASPQQVQAVHEFLRTSVGERDKSVAAALRILYGGSVKAANAQALFAQADIDGALVGGASLLADEFARICQSAT